MNVPEILSQTHIRRRSYLEKLASSGSAPARKFRRASIFLKSDCSEDGPNWIYEAICDAFDVNVLNVANVRIAFVEGGLENSLNRKKLDWEYEHLLDRNAEAHLIALACSEAPEGFERWTLRLLQNRFVKIEIVESVSNETIRTALKKTNLNLG